MIIAISTRRDATPPVSLTFKRFFDRFSSSFGEKSCFVRSKDLVTEIGLTDREREKERKRDRSFLPRRTRRIKDSKRKCDRGNGRKK